MKTVQQGIGQERGWGRSRTGRAGLLGVAGVVIVAGAWVIAGNPYTVTIAILACLYAVVAASWDLTLGYAGLFDFSHAAFFGIGAYVCGMITVDLNWSPWLGLVGAIAGGAVGAALVAGSVARLRGIYVALASFAFAELVATALTSSQSISGGASGMVLIPTLQLGPWDLSGNTTTFLYIAIGAVIFSAVAMRWLMSSTFGLGVRAMRDYEEYALSRGVPVARHRIQIIAVSSMFASGAGALFALYTGVASPDLFGFSTSTLLLTMVILGGIGSVYGPVVGAVAVTAFVNIPQIAALNTETYLITGALILVILWILPGGLWSVLRRARAGRRGVVEY